MNAPERFELFVLPDGVKKVTVERDTKIPNACSMIIEKEDHTLGNILRMELLRDPKVIFAGYKVPHPLVHNLVLKVQTTPAISPITATQNAISRLNAELSNIEKAFAKEVEKQNSDQSHF
eukprot:GCRY01002300.1.p1 GENE.GCRY01002300.1~~GCRY01002300.1.p1  ORF type:complete len:120 (-),score=17.49 GCRY01002300.1:168-527(-)